MYIYKSAMLQFFQFLLAPYNVDHFMIVFTYNYNPIKYIQV